jgi:hypothetical protein
MSESWPAPGSFVLIQGADGTEGAMLIGEWVRANNVDPASVDGVLGVRADYGNRQLVWFESGTRQRRTARMLVEPSDEVLQAALSSRRPAP